MNATPPDQRRTLANDLATLYAVHKPRAWRVDAIAAAGRLVTGFALLALGAWYDFHKLAPGPITLGVLAAYVLPPTLRAIAQHRAESEWAVRQQQQITMLAQQLGKLPHMEIVTRLAALTARGARTTDVIEAASVLALGASRDTLSDVDDADDIEVDDATGEDDVKR